MREFLKLITPPIIRQTIVQLRDRNANPLFDQEYWGEFRIDFDPELAVMTDAFLRSKDFPNTSKFWLMLMHTHLEYVRRDGLESFGENVARHYFTGTDFSEAQIRNLVQRDAPTQRTKLDILKVHRGFTISESIKHNVLIQLLLNLAESQDSSLELLRSLDSAGFLFGGHPVLDYDGIVITFDKLNSALEVEVILSSIAAVESPVFLEIGSGSGRTADALLKLRPKSKYVIADIPPASYVSIKRLRFAYPDKKIRFVEDLNQLKLLISAPSDWDVLFVLPEYLSHFPDKFFSVTLAIDCLHEMNAGMRTYFADIAEKKSNYYYFKIWNETEIPLDEIHLSATDLSDYGVRSEWSTIVGRECTFPADFSEFLFKI